MQTPSETTKRDAACCAKSNGSYTFPQTSGHISQLRKGSVSPIKILTEVWLAPAPLHEARRTKKSASTLKAKLGIGQLAFVSDNSDAQFNAYLQILSSSKPHSEVASTTHTFVLNTSSTHSASVFSDPLLTPRLLDRSRFYIFSPRARFSSSAWILSVGLSTDPMVTS